jgi:D-glycero-D-manno-heptose 1,7-bisphosphate phosphatase
MGAGRAVFLDRDGVINRNVLNPATGEYEAPLTAADFALIPGVGEALRRLQGAGYLLFLVSNQPNYAKGKSSMAELNAIDAELRRELAGMGVEFAAFYYCFHHPEGIVEGYSVRCACRKPSQFFLLKASKEFGIDLQRSWMVGDRATDIFCGYGAGARTILIRTKGVAAGGIVPDRTAVDLGAAAEIICGSGLEAGRDSDRRLRSMPRADCLPGQA